MIRELQLAGTRALFGVPGGGSGTELIEAARIGGLPFVLSHTESAGAFMACAQAEILGRPAACIATLGPGAASVTNGVAHAFLDRVPLVVLTDTHPSDIGGFVSHQTVDHHGLFSAITKRTVSLGANPAATISAAIATAATAPAGPVHVDCAPDVLATRAEPQARSTDEPPATGEPEVSRELAAMLRSARRPIMIVGLGARAADDVAAVRALAERHGIPALVTYKAKGTVPDSHPLFAGMFTDGAAEAGIVDRADLMIGVGLDPVELLPKRWHHGQPIVYCGPRLQPQRQVPFAAELIGPIPPILDRLSGYLVGSAWAPQEIARSRDDLTNAMRVAGDGLAPFRVVELAAERFAPTCRLTVDAGAHMFPAVALWAADRPAGVLISNGISTMGFALPTAIGAALIDDQPVVAMTGDGGLLMCCAELKTAARERLRIRVIVFDDHSLSLIRIKQEQRGYLPAGVELGRIDWPALARSFGVEGFVARDEPSLRDALDDAARIDGPALVAASVDGSVYGETIRRLRG